jgi:hypothetical protein
MGDGGGKLMGIAETDQQGDSGSDGISGRAIPNAPVGRARRAPPGVRSGVGVEQAVLKLINDVVARRLREHDLACQVDARDERYGLAALADQVASHGDGSVTTIAVISPRATTATVKA